MRDKLLITGFKNRIIKAYIIGNNPNYFKRQLTDKIKYVVKNKLHQALKHIFLSLNIEIKKATILLSPSSASYDQYRNFNERGDQFKKIVKSYAKKFNQSFENELKRILIHGSLHLCGYDDQTPKDKSEMTSLEENYLAKFRESILS